MSTTGNNLVAQINTYVRNYAVEAFHNMRLNAILLQIIAWIDSGGTTGPVTVASVKRITSANFINATDCPLPAYNALNIEVFWNEAGRWLNPGVDVTPYVGGGFTVLIPGFDSTLGTYNFLISIAA